MPLLRLLRTLLALLFSCAVFFSLPAASAPSLQIDGHGKLLGATGVDVGGVLYDVTFHAGTCASLFSGCQSPADFMFGTQSSAIAASFALLGQVLLDGPSGSFDSIPLLTNGCESDPRGLCAIHTPYSVDSGFLRTGAAHNLAVESSDDAFGSGFPASVDLSVANPVDTFAVWTLASPVPEPGTYAMMLVGLGLFGAIARRRRVR